MAANDFVYASIPLPTDVSAKNTEASADISAGQVVKLDTTNVVSGTQSIPGVKLVAATTDYPYGVAMENIPNGKVGRIRTTGVAQVVAGAAVSAGAIVMPNATAGKVITQTAAKPQLGQAMTAANADGDKILVDISRAFNA